MEEIKRMYVIQQVVVRKMTATEAGKHLRLSIRQVRRLVVKFREKGAEGLIHGNRGRPAQNRVADAVRIKIQELAEEEYKDYNDCYFTEELKDEYGLQVSRSTVRRIRREIGQKSPRKYHPARHHSRRVRKSKTGLLLQADGSRHDWLEGRGPMMTLVGYIDDASNEVLGARFRAEEDAAGYFMGLRDICQLRGIPAGVYVDRHTIFQSPRKATLEQELAGEKPKSQFGRLLDELGIELIIAHSPQAKGRVERLWGTLQDRLVKVLRKAGASNLEEANQVLQKYLPGFNQRFSVKPQEDETAYVPWPQELQVEDFFCFKFWRTVANDNTIALDGHRLQIPPGEGKTSYAHKQVEVRQHLDGHLEIRYQNQCLASFEPANEQAVRVKKFTPAPGQIAQAKPTPEVKHIKHGQPPIYKPAANHPWRQFQPKQSNREKDEQELSK